MLDQKVLILKSNQMRNTLLKLVLFISLVNQPEHCGMTGKSTSLSTFRFKTQKMFR